MMQILHVITGLRKAAGTSTFCGEVCNQLAALGHDVTIAVCNPAAPNTYPLDPRVHLVSIESIIHCPPTFSTYSLIHLHGLWSLPLHRVAHFARSHNIPHVWSTHGMTAPWALHHKWWKKCLPWYLYQRRDLQRANLIHCTSDFEVEWNRKLGFEKTFLAPLGTFLPEIKKIGVENRCRWTLLFVGRIYPVKALDRLIEAFALAIKNQNLQCPPPPTFSTSPWRLRLVGPDQASHMAELMAFCECLGLSYVQEKIGVENRCTFKHSNNVEVEFAGPKFGADLDAEYAACTALALVSHTENFGATVVDALAHGKPVITSITTPWSCVAASHCGWWVSNSVVPLAKALQELFASSDEDLQAMGANGRKLVESQFTWPAVARALQSNYENCVSKKDDP